jgi:hypothetical protein
VEWTGEVEPLQDFSKLGYRVPEELGEAGGQFRRAADRFPTPTTTSSRRSKLLRGAIRGLPK